MLINVIDISCVRLSLNVLFMHVGGEGPRSINRRDGREISQGLRLCVRAEFLCPLLCKLKNTGEVLLLEYIPIHLLIIKINLVGV